MDIKKSPGNGYIRLKAILAILPISRSTWWAGVKSGRFPQPVKLGPRTTAWKIDDIVKLMEELDQAAKASFAVS